MKTAIAVAALALLVVGVSACGQSEPQLPPGYVMGPNGVPIPQAMAGQIPGVPGAVPGVPAPMPGYPAAPPAPMDPALAAAPAGAITPTAAPGALPSIGVAECDGYVARACNCNNEAVRAMMCQAASTMIQNLQATVAVARDSVVQACTMADQGIRATCSQ